ncbi:Lrp/AsnC family transcriptional regulator [Staphylococcus sp. NRL 16/872]|uniref:Lrp/AsnC family transcriptional regulator n=1 Tax=Staphylococcus sp. NRL 16/872 TaxID=2930131 RepID=UPI001FB524D3|nr:MULTISPECIES: Lrp/AsnC family transcriptional regulator [unclassified Staphylococcus]MCJ1655309.1 Lrp/AsnC family transcriptional regulator [Staphylococcus sp. NRL 21/187]MCJ1661145.1 Lrp/AsnC family transcriptional regulator [Staphylococcus sp. NRL 18/288]MCJ1667038.1 Lrp/AsnC family transcriptional regulator [Staphylococcus sp. NRL 19/737]WEN69513.1 Lrp/AsnC family transcriptional regulator [Staphylococcus sp. NRL 16/872]
MDYTNINLLNILKENSKLSLSELSQKVNLSVPSTRERIHKLIDSGIIKNYTINIDYSLLGYDIEAIIELTIKNNLYKDFKNYISEQENVAFCYRISGDSCFMFKARFKDMKKAENFIDSLQKYGHSKTHFIFSKVV